MKRILVVDDARTVRMVIRQMLESRGCSVFEAENGLRALEHCRSLGPPDGVILDINMPEMDGLACLRAMRQDPALAACLVVMCTTQVEAHHIAEAVRAGANEYIMKPFTQEILFDKLRQVGLLE
jgi:two-component system chemotaxis response regulator CheY